MSNKLIGMMVVASLLAGWAGAEVTVTGEKKFERADLVIANTDRQDDFRCEVFGPTVVVVTDPIPAGKLMLEVDLAELYFQTGGQRSMAIFCGDKMLTPQMDVFEAAGGFAKALTRSYPIDHLGGPVVVRFVGIKENAKFNALRVKDAGGQLLVQVRAKDATVKAMESTKPFRLLKPEELVFFNADHAPFGAYAELVYGHEGQQGGFAKVNGGVPNTGVLLGTVDAEGSHLMPFTAWPSDIQRESIRRTLRACTDAWVVPGLSWTHYCPSWKLANLEKATLKEKKRFVLPATWIEFTLDNSKGTTDRTLVFGLPVQGEKRTFADGRYAGFVFDGVHCLAVPAGDCELLEGDGVRKVLPMSASGSVFAMQAKPGESKTLRVIVGHYDQTASTGSLQAKFYYTSLFGSMDEVVAEAGQSFASAKAQCQSMDALLEKSGINVYRKFLAGHSMHSYRYNTCLLMDSQNRPVFSEPEGEYRFINTFDLTVDHAFYQLAMHPWTLRNVLDHYASRYAYRDEVVDPRTGQVHPGGLSFAHDMGVGMDFSKQGVSAYEPLFKVNMTVEELQNWILCAGLYWKKTDDKAWLASHAATVHDCLQSLLVRDDVDEARRDGVISFVNHPKDYSEEITTYDALDHSLKQTRDNLYIAVKNWASYLALEAMLAELKDADGAKVAQRQAERAAATVMSHWNATDRYIPAIFDGKNTSRIIPAVEALIYPQQMGLASAVALDGPYGQMVRMLRDHLDTVLQLGVCLDAVSGGWKLSSTSNNTWQSKVYLSQYVAERILKMTGDRISGPVDAVHASFQVLGVPQSCWSDQLDSSSGRGMGSLHYPRGITSALWWLDNNEKYITP